MKPILFNTEMVRAILEGRKTVTRRIIPERTLDKYYDYDEWCNAVMPHDIPCTRSYEKDFFMEKPPYRPGDILYVRETWGTWSRTDGIMPKLYYKADRSAPEGIKWRSSIRMPREAARLFLRVTDVRVERLQEMTDDDFVRDFGFCREAIQAVGRDALAISLWDSTVKKPADLAIYGWAANPWVWVIEFERCGKQEECKERPW